MSVVLVTFPNAPKPTKEAIEAVSWYALLYWSWGNAFVSTGKKTSERSQRKNRKKDKK